MTDSIIITGKSKYFPSKNQGLLHLVRVTGSKYQLTVSKKNTKSHRLTVYYPLISHKLNGETEAMTSSVYNHHIIRTRYALFVQIK